jgi:hypothetical protein
MSMQQAVSTFALCVEDGGMVDLEVRKVYQVIPDGAANREGYIRVVDGSGEDYLYPADFFVPAEPPAQS